VFVARVQASLREIEKTNPDSDLHLSMGIAESPSTVLPSAASSPRRTTRCTERSAGQEHREVAEG